MKPKIGSIPTSVYRLQMSEQFTLADATALLPYLKNLGIEGIYLSPIYDSFSSHGYDVTDPNRLNPLIGTSQDFKEFCHALKKLKLKLILDVIPNHMGIHGGKNAWWQDVLENGPHSAFASFFDIHWTGEQAWLKDKVLLPFLSDFYGKVLENQQIKLHYKEGRFYCTYQDYKLPINPKNYCEIIDYKSLNIKELIGVCSLLNSTSQEKRASGVKKLFLLVQSDPSLKDHITARLALYNGKKRDAPSFDLLDRLLSKQYYRLAYWEVASSEINYRRFFDINELVAIRVEEERVLEATHRWIFELVQAGNVQGLRIDHPDGLYDPVQYFDRMRARFPLYLVVEKILDDKEELPSNWEVDGTVGYEFMNLLNGMFIKKDQEENFTTIYENFIEEKMDFDQVLYLSKKHFTEVYMVSEIKGLGLFLDQLSEKNRYFRDFTREQLTKVMQEVIAYFPVYRTYIGPKGGISKRDAKYILLAIEKALEKTEYPLAMHFLKNILLLKKKFEGDLAYREFILRFQQLTGPIMAKGMEDTAFYIYNRFISLNEVGGSPDHFGRYPADFHHFNRIKAEKWPWGFLPASTHDTKRSHDVRMRLNVLSEIPDAWNLEIRRWKNANQGFKREVEGNLVPSPNTEYYLYQTLVGVWPKHLLERDWEENRERIWETLLKSVREAKVDTNWAHPNKAYEEALRDFVVALFENEEFLTHFLAFQKRVDRFGGWNSLASEVLRLGAPGVVDLYQGDELWNYKLVDPDNRSAVDYERREELLQSLKKNGKKESFGPHLSHLFASGEGRLKLYLHWKCLNFREEKRELFLSGEYIPIRARGQRSEHVVAYLRRNGEEIALVIAARFFATMINTDWGLPLGPFIWGDTELLLPEEWKGKKLRDLLTSQEIQVRNHRGHAVISVAEVFEFLPFATLVI